MREKREKRWSPTEIENWAKSQGCSSVGNLPGTFHQFHDIISTDWSKSTVNKLKKFTGICRKMWCDECNHLASISGVGAE